MIRPRARVSLWTTAGNVRLSSYTCLAQEALEQARRDLAAEGPGCYATVAALDGSMWIRLESQPETGTTLFPTPGLKLL